MIIPQNAQSIHRHLYAFSSTAPDMSSLLMARLEKDTPEESNGNGRPFPKSIPQPEAGSAELSDNSVRRSEIFSFVSEHIS